MEPLTPTVEHVRSGDVTFDQTLDAFGVGSEAVRAELRIRRGEQRRLTDVVGSSVRATILRTADLHEFREWIGHAPSPAVLERFDASLRPSAPWCGRRVASFDELTVAERQDVEKAMKVFLFGDSRSVADYEQVLEACYAPFRAAAYAIRRLVIEPGASLHVAGLPAVLLVENFDLHDGGTLHLDTITSAVIGQMRKLTA
jgi:hypothetical protein